MGIIEIVQPPLAPAINTPDYWVPSTCLFSFFLLSFPPFFFERFFGFRLAVSVEIYLIFRGEEETLELFPFNLFEQISIFYMLIFFKYIYYIFINIFYFIRKISTFFLQDFAIYSIVHAHTHTHIYIYIYW